MLRCFLALSLVAILLPAQASAQRSKKKDQDFIKTAPVVGDSLPVVEVHTPDGKPFSTSELRGHYTVLVFGCLT
jgi:cytochrome oxidase Cu insertion factor (SCO1/SenC/PrrC family)